MRSKLRGKPHRATSSRLGGTEGGFEERGRIKGVKRESGVNLHETSAIPRSIDGRGKMADWAVWSLAKRQARDLP